MGLQRGAELGHKTLALSLREMERALEALLRGLCQRHDGLSKLKQLRFGLAYKAHQHFALAPALPAKATHDLLKVVLELSGLGRQRGHFRGALRRDVLDELEDFF